MKNFNKIPTKYIILSVVFAFYIFSINAVINFNVQKDFQTRAKVEENVIAYKKKAETTKKPKSMLEHMIENGTPEIVIETTIKRMAELGSDINDWILVEPYGYNNDGWVVVEP